MGKLDLIKGQLTYIVDKSTKRKKPHESDHGENAAGRLGKVKKPRKPKNNHEMAPMQNYPSNQWKILNHQAFQNPSQTTHVYSAFPPATNITAMAIPSSSKVHESSFPVDPLRPAKRAKVSTPSTFPSTGDSMCLLCGGPKHDLRDCPVPKGGTEK